MECGDSQYRFGLEIKTASLLVTVTTSFNPFIKRVLPVLTISKTASAKPMLVAISTLPLISSMKTEMFFQLEQMTFLSQVGANILMKMNTKFQTGFEVKTLIKKK